MTFPANKKIKRAIVRLLPPVLVDLLIRLHGNAGGNSQAQAEWKMGQVDAATWDQGWQHSSITETQLAGWQSFMKSADEGAPFGLPPDLADKSAADIGLHNTIVSFGYALGRALDVKRKISILDWGGGPGHYHIYAQRLFPDATFEYVVKDFDGICAAGRELQPGVIFESDDERALSRRYDFVFASSAIQYSRDVYGLLERLCDSSDKWLMVTRQPIVEQRDDFVVIQYPHRYGYMTEYPGWVMNRGRLIDFIQARGFNMEREFLVAERHIVPGAPEQLRYSGFLFRRH